jgi:type II secretory pathway pseudopilin PulG
VKTVLSAKRDRGFTLLHSRIQRAFTLFEVLIVLAVLMLLVVLLLPLLAHSKGGGHSKRIRCVNNLKQVTLAFKIWSGDCGDSFPTGVSMTNGGSKEMAMGTNMFFTFTVMSNELNTPRVLFCPEESDLTRQQAIVWGPASDLNNTLFSGNTNTSYFVGLDADDGHPQMFLVGDHTLTNGSPIIGGLLELRTNRSTGWTVGNHRSLGNIGLADASVGTFSTTQLRKALAETGAATNRLSMP